MGRPQHTQKARWMSAVLACGSDAVLSDESAAQLWRIRPLRREDPIEVTVPPDRRRERPGIVVHHRALASGDLATRDRIPLTGPIRTLVQLGLGLGPRQLEAAVNEADKLGLVDPETLRRALEQLAGEPGVPNLRGMLDRHTFALTDSELERGFLALARRAGLPVPLTRHWLNGFRVDFFWADLGLVVETDGLTYHRTPAAQARDRLRDQRHTAAGLTCLRFTHWQIAHERGYVVATLEAVARRLVSRG
ncbi:MAG TPA: DUF559 domain-containing protein [Solirubrobacterales bacterium]|nr:DUF559 domain-containing protein [Solirubrobacterales bacterium]